MDVFKKALPDIGKQIAYIIIALIGTLVSKLAGFVIVAAVTYIILSKSKADILLDDDMTACERLFYIYMKKYAYILSAILLILAILFKF